MNKEELIKRLEKYEWNDFECKKAQRGVSEDTYKTVSAFANTKGGYLVFGIEDQNGQLEIVGVLEVDKVQNDFLSSLRGGKLNRIIAVQEGNIEHEGKTLLTFFVPESPRNEKPVYLNLRGDIRKCFIRRGSGDEQCTNVEIERFIRDASDIRYDGEAIKTLSHDVCFDEDTISWYRKIFNQYQPGPHESLNNIDFLHEWGFLSEDQATLFPTRASILLFGKGKYIRQILQRGIVDFQRIDDKFDEWMPEKRWHDRVVYEENIFQTWLGLSGKYMSLAEKPFSVNVATLRRNAGPPDYISFREAAINLLIHQDYGDHTRKPVIKLFRDLTIFWNPGDAFATESELLTPTEKEVRNPSIVSAFRRIGLSDQAGTGIRSIYKNWHDLGNVPPIISNNKAGKTFEIILPKMRLLSEEQILIQCKIGAHLTEDQAAVFAFACKNESLTIRILDIRAITGKKVQECTEIANHLVVQNLLSQVNSEIFSVADHLKLIVSQILKPEKNDLVSNNHDQVANDDISNLVTHSGQVDKITDPQRVILPMCEAPCSLVELQNAAEYGNRGYFKSKVVNPLITIGLLQMTKPDKPRAKDQKYVLTEGGLRLVQSWRK